QGKGVAQDDKQAVTWFRKAAEQGDAKAQGLLGIMYVQGKGVAQDDKQAVTWFRKAAEQGDATAQYLMGVLGIFRPKTTKCSGGRAVRGLQRGITFR
ncbi:tetratricopeptide repeat protein, partial [Aeromonas caviae]